MPSCVHCGAPIDPSDSQCPYCGQAILWGQRPSAAQALAKRIEQVEAGRPITQERGIFSQALTDCFPSAVDRQEISMIQSCIIPNTKKDIIEFAVLASSNIRPEVFGFLGGTPIGSPQRMISDAWVALLEQAFQKAKMLLEGTPEYYAVEQQYLSKKKEIKKKKRQFLVALVILAYIVLLFIALGSAVLLLK